MSFDTSLSDSAPIPLWGTRSYRSCPDSLRDLETCETWSTPRTSARPLEDEFMQAASATSPSRAGALGLSLGASLSDTAPTRLGTSRRCMGGELFLKPACSRAIRVSCSTRRDIGVACLGARSNPTSLCGSMRVLGTSGANTPPFCAESRKCPTLATGPSALRAAAETQSCRVIAER